MFGTCGQSLSRGDRSRARSFGEQYGGVVTDGIGSTKKLSSIRITGLSSASLPSPAFVADIGGQVMSDKRHKDPDLSLTERGVRRAFREAGARKAMTEYEKEQKAFHKNRERLKAERLAREAAKLKEN